MYVHDSKNCAKQVSVRYYAIFRSQNLLIHEAPNYPNSSLLTQTKKKLALVPFNEGELTRFFFQAPSELGN